METPWVRQPLKNQGIQLTQAQIMMRAALGGADIVHCAERTKSKSLVAMPMLNDGRHSTDID
jgi:hypothetical protein